MGFLPLLLLLLSPQLSDTLLEFDLSFTDANEVQTLLEAEILHAQSGELTVASVGGRTALKLSTTAEFSDAFIELERLLGRPVDFSDGGYLTFGVYVPPGSEVMSVKFNQRDVNGNFGGCGNYLNKLYGQRGKWIEVSVPLSEQYSECRNWVGEGDFLGAVSAISLNPYNANQVDTATLYLSHLRLSRHPVSRARVVQRLAERPYVKNNNPHTITFDDPNLLARQQAYRTFEATTQQLAAGKFGNPTVAIRSYGSGENRYICWLPDIEQMTGHPVDFRTVDSLHFRYYLTPQSDRIDGARLFITTGDDWDGILIAENFMKATDFVRGSWTRHVVALADLELTPVDEPGDVLSQVYEMRLDLKYDATAGPIEIWYDDFGWK